MLDRRASIQAGDGDGNGGLILYSRGGISYIAQTQASGLEGCSYLGSFTHFSLLIGGLRVSDDGGCYFVCCSSVSLSLSQLFPSSLNLWNCHVDTGCTIRFC